MKFIYILIVCSFYLLSAQSVFAQYYQYVDKNGIQHFTDDITEIPKDLRPNLTIHQSIQTPAKKESLKVKPAITLESLGIQKDELDIEYKALVQKREDLAKQKKAMGETEYNKIATQLNIEIKQYQEKSDAYEILVQQYNRQMTSTDKK